MFHFYLFRTDLLQPSYVSVYILPPNGFSLGHNKILTYSMQCSGNLGVWAMVHSGKLICKQKKTKSANSHTNTLHSLGQSLFLYFTPDIHQHIINSTHPRKTECCKFESQTKCQKVSIPHKKKVFSKWIKIQNWYQS